ncbi:MAG: hypothetical protein L0216_03215 [Planctomycetales bacterium]|nr:hypothetical protein [Planctomycetales bacterium]
MSDAPPLPEHPDAPDLLVMQCFGVEPEHAAHAARRASLMGLLLWAPMAVAAVVERTALPGRVEVPFLFDVAAYVRPLVAIPLLLVSEPILAAAWRRTGARFRERGIVGPECREAYDALVHRVTRAVRRPVPELLCLAVAVALVIRLVSLVVSAPRDTWFAIADSPETSRLTFAGAWAGFVVHTFLFYLVLRWLWLLSLWYRFLLGVARLPLRLYPPHPDRAGGLGFVGWSIAAVAPIVFACSAAISSVVANRVIHSGDRLVDFAVAGGVFLVVVLLLFVLPPALVFMPLLARTRRQALEAWGRRMARCAEGISDDPPPDAPSGAAAPPLTLQDFEVAVSTVRGMRPFPLEWHMLLGPLAAAVVPALALFFIAFPASEVFQQLMRLVM